MKSLVFLCQKSIVVRQKKSEKAEQCEDDASEIKAVPIFEEDDNELDLLSEEDDEDDEDYDCMEDYERDLYDSKLDGLDEVIFCRDIIAAMEQQNP